MKIDLKNFQPKILHTLKNYTREQFIKDLMAGLIVGIVALPLAIAFGIASGVSPEQGLYTAIIAGFIISLLGGSKVQIGGPTGAFIVIVYGIVQEFGITGLAIATIIAGIMLILMGVLKLGTVIKFIPFPVVVGFTSGIALTIFATQIKDLFGLEVTKVPADFIDKWIVYGEHWSTFNPWSMGVGIGTVLIIGFSTRFIKKVPGSLIAIILMTVVVYFLKEKLGVSIETIGDRFTINPSLPSVTTPKITMETINTLMPAAFTIAMLGAIESLLSATVADGVIGDKHDSNTELIAQGVANIFSPIFGGIPATGAIARTMTNINNGGRTPVAGIIHSIVLLLILLFLGNLTKHIPMACLAGVLVIVSYNMSEWRTFRNLLKGNKSDVAVLIATFFFTVIFDLTVAIEIGLILALVLFLRRISSTSGISVIKDQVSGKDLPDEIQDDEGILNLHEGVEIYEIEGPFFFGTANKFEETMKVVGTRAKVRILRMRKVPFIDSSGTHNLEALVKYAHKEKTVIILSGVNENVRSSLDKSGISSLIGEPMICKNIHDALAKADEIVSKNA